MKKFKKIILDKEQLNVFNTEKRIKLVIKARSNCKFMNKYLDDLEYIGNVLSGCGVPITYYPSSPFGEKNQILDYLNAKITYIHHDENINWVIWLEKLS